MTDHLDCMDCGAVFTMTQVYANASEFEMIAGGFLLCPLCGNPLRDTSTINQQRPVAVLDIDAEPEGDVPMPDAFAEFIAGLDL